MNRHQRRKERAVQRCWTQGMVIKTRTFRDQEWNIYWMEEPVGFRPEDGIPPGTEIHGPFDTSAEAEADERLFLLGPDCVVREGGMWDPAWDRMQ